jgi:hypothetical protein
MGKFVVHDANQELIAARKKKSRHFRLRTYRLHVASEDVDNAQLAIETTRRPMTGEAWLEGEVSTIEVTYGPVWGNCRKDIRAVLESHSVVIIGDIDVVADRCVPGPNPGLDGCWHLEATK